MIIDSRCGSALRIVISHRLIHWFKSCGSFVSCQFLILSAAKVLLAHRSERIIISSSHEITKSAEMCAVPTPLLGQGTCGCTCALCITWLINRESVNQPKCKIKRARIVSTTAGMGPSTWPELGRYPDPIEGVRLLWQGFVGHQFSLLNLQGTYLHSTLPKRAFAAFKPLIKWPRKFQSCGQIANTVIIKVKPHNFEFLKRDL